jgi:hypothetical protein
VLIHTEGSGAGEEGLAFLIRRDAGPGLTGNEGISLEYGTTYKLSVTLSFDAINLNDNGGFQVYSFGGTSGSGNNANLDNHGWENDIVPPVIVTGTGYAGIGGTTADPGFVGVPGTPEGSLFLTADVVSQTYQVTGITLQNDAEQDGIVFQAFAGRGGNLTLESVTLEVETSVTDGDFDGDGDVDGIDFLFWQRGESLGGGTQAELALWELNYGASSSSAAVATAPEPSTAVAFSLAILITSIGSRSRRQR